MTEIVKKVKSIRWQYLMIIIMVAMVAVGTESCKSTGGMSRKEKKAQIEMYKKQLQEIVAGTSKLSLDEQQRLISDAVNKNFNDPELNALIIQAQQKTKAAYAEQVKSQEQKIAAARTTLYDLLANKDNLTADQLQTELNKVKAQKIQDGEIDDLIGRVQEKIDKMKLSGTAGPLKTQLESAFDGIAVHCKGRRHLHCQYHDQGDHLKILYFRKCTCPDHHQQGGDVSLIMTSQPPSSCTWISSKTRKQTETMSTATFTMNPERSKNLI